MAEKWSYRPTYLADVYRTEKYILCLSNDEYHQTVTSHEGWHMHAAEPASAVWIGSNLRKSLLTGKQYRFEPQEWDQKAAKKYISDGIEIYHRIIKGIASIYRYRSENAAAAKALNVSVSYPRDSRDPITLLAMNRKRGGMYEAIANTSPSLAVVKRVPMEAGDEELGLAVREMLAISTLSGERVEME